MDLLVASRREVMRHVEGNITLLIPEYLKPIDENWQPSDLLPDSSGEEFFDQIREIQERAGNLSYDLLAVLIGDTITEEALPTYESWLSMVDDVEREYSGGWLTWIRKWTAEENRHGDALNRYLYLSGRVNMKMMEVTTQYLIADGTDVQTGRDPYRNFVYTSFQELATNVSHRRVASLAKKDGDTLLSKMCGMIASDEARHAKAYKHFMTMIFEIDPNEAMLAFEDMMRRKIVMPANFMRELGGTAGETFQHFTDAAIRTGVYTAYDYIDIFKSLITDWKIEQMQGLNSAGEQAREYLCNLPSRLIRVAERSKINPIQHQFSWILPDKA